MKPVKNPDRFVIGSKIFSSRTESYYGEVLSTPPCRSWCRTDGGQVESACYTCPSDHRWIGIKATVALETAWGSKLKIEDGITLFCPMNIPSYIIKMEVFE